MGKDLNGKELGTGISQRPDGIYMARAQCCGKPICIYGRNYQKLKKELEEKKKLARENNGRIPEQYTLSEWFEIWFTTYKEPTVSEQSVGPMRSKVFPLFKLYGESAAIATALAVTGFLSIPLHAYSISAVTGVLRAGGDVFWSTLLDVGPQWCMALPLTALLALVLKADYWWIAAAIQSESLLKVPLCALRIRTGQWIHDVTVRKERGQ